MLGELPAVHRGPSQVASGAERFVPGPREDDDSQRTILLGARERLRDPGYDLGADRVAAIGSVDGDSGDAGARLVENDFRIHRSFLTGPQSRADLGGPGLGRS